MRYLKKEESDDVDFLGPDKHETIVQVDTINHGGHNKFEKYFYYLKEEMRDEVFFFCADEHHSYL